MSSALKHIEHLSQSPRGSATEQEKAGHEYVQKTLSDLGLETRTETFLSSTSPYLPFILALGLAFVYEALYWFIAGTENAASGALYAFVLIVALLVSVILELSTLDNPLRWFLPVAPSQNVIGVIPASGEAKRKIAILAHVDSHRTPWIWGSRTNFKIYQAVVPLGLVSVILLGIMYLVSVFAPNSALRPLTLIPTAIVALAWLMVLQAHNTPFTHGANDNASGVGVLLSLAEQLKQTPLASAEVWCVATGCEEVGAYGSADFVRRHASEFQDGAVIVVDNIATPDSGPVYLDAEGILLPAKYPPEMLALAEKISTDRPELGARPFTQQGAYTDGYPALKAGLRTLTFVGYTKDGWLPNWHNKTDVFANVDGEAVERTEQFVMEALKRLEIGD